MNKEQLSYLYNLVSAFDHKPTRTQLHKISFFVAAADQVEVPFEFVLYHYGPYSFDLDEAIQELVDAGYLHADYNPNGFGAGYEFSKAIADPKLSQDVSESIRKWVKLLGNEGVRRLELVATSLYVNTKRHEDSRERQIEQVINIKPHFTTDEVEEAFNWLRTVDALKN
jgi:uncharacterized protein YwgA